VECGTFDFNQVGYFSYEQVSRRANATIECIQRQADVLFRMVLMFWPAIVMIIPKILLSSWIEGKWTPFLPDD